MIPESSIPPNKKNKLLNLQRLPDTTKTVLICARGIWRGVPLAQFPLPLTNYPHPSLPVSNSATPFPLPITPYPLHTTLYPHPSLPPSNSPTTTPFQFPSLNHSFICSMVQQQPKIWIQTSTLL